MSSSGEDVKRLSVILREINEHTDEAQLEKLRFLVRGLFRTGHVDDADSVSSLHRTMAQRQDTSKRAVFYLHYMLKKASVKPECTNQLSSYVEEVHAPEMPPTFYFREMLFDVAENFNQQQFKSFRDVVEYELKASVNKFKNALQVFQRLIDLETLKMEEESLDQLKKWLVGSGMGNTAEEVVQVYKESIEGELYCLIITCTGCVSVYSLLRPSPPAARAYGEAPACVAGRKGSHARLGVCTPHIAVPHIVGGFRGDKFCSCISFYMYSCECLFTKKE